MRGQFVSLLQDIGFVGRDAASLQHADKHKDNINLIKAVLVAGLYPNVASVRHPMGTAGVGNAGTGTGTRGDLAVPQTVSRTCLLTVVLRPAGRNFGKVPPKLSTREDGKVKLHPKSVLSDDTVFPTKWLVYHQKVETSAIFMHDATSKLQCWATELRLLLLCVFWVVYELLSWVDNGGSVARGRRRAWRGDGGLGFRSKLTPAHIAPLVVFRSGASTGAPLLWRRHFPWQGWRSGHGDCG